MLVQEAVGLLEFDPELAPELVREAEQESLDSNWDQPLTVLNVEHGEWVVLFRSVSGCV